MAPAKSKYRKVKPSKRQMNMGRRTTKKLSIYKGLNQYTVYPFTCKLLPNILHVNGTNSVIFTVPQPGTQGGFLNCSGAPLSSTSIGTIQTSSTAYANYIDVGLAAAFKATDLNQWSTWRGLYDAYRIDRVDCTIDFLSNTSSVGGSTLLPSMYIYNDQDDAVPPNQLNFVTSKQGVRKIQFANKMQTSIKHSCVPHSAGYLKGLAAPSNQYSVNKPHQWINSTSDDVAHYAMKFYITDILANSANALAFKFNFTYKMSFRGPLIAT